MTRSKLPVLATLCLCTALGTTPVLAGMSLQQIRYALHKDPNAAVEQDLRELADRGDRPSMHLLGNVLAADQTKADEAVDFYKRAFDEGRGEVGALSSLSRLLDRNALLRSNNEAFVRAAIQRYPHTRDVRTLGSTLEVFTVYPQLFSAAYMETLLQLYERSCLELCSGDYYRAVIAERSGRREEADHWYRRAIRTELRAVDRYYAFLGDKQDQLFPEFARSLAPEMTALPVEVVYRVGSLLESINNEQRSAAASDDRAADEAHKATPEQIAAREARDKLFISARDEAQTWIDHAVAASYLPAMIAKVNYMTSWPAEHSGGEAIAMIRRIEPLDANRAKAQLSQVHMVTNWDTLAPHRAHELIQELIASHYRDATLLLGDLYSKGGLDEPDQERALNLYQKLADEGSITAYYRIANVYFTGRAICHDKVKAHSYAKVAAEAGDNRARSLMRNLERHMNADELEQARQAYENMHRNSQS